MRPGNHLLLLLAACIAAGAPVLVAQASGSADQQSSPQNNGAQKSAGPQPQAGPQTEPQPKGNPFPQDVNSVPVMPSGNTPYLAPDMSGGGGGNAAAPAEDSDPVRSPEDAAPSDNGETEGFSSSRSGLDNLTTPPDTGEPGRRNKRNGSGIVDMPRETPKEDVNVGKYYMDTHDWKGALSRFQSALVLAPDNPDVYWGLAECQRHLGQFAAARDNYLKVMEYDPDSHHAKDAKKALKDPRIANAKPAGQP